MPGFWGKLFGGQESQPAQSQALTAGEVKRMFQDASWIVQELERNSVEGELRQRLSAYFSDKLQDYSLEELNTLLLAIPDAAALIRALNKVQGLRNIDTSAVGTMAETFMSTLISVRMDKNRNQ